MNTPAAPARSLAFFVTASIALALAAPSRAQMPRVGQTAKNFTLEAHGGGKVSLASALRRGGPGPVVLVVLRGYPGYQWPACTAQVGDLLRSAPQFQSKKAMVLLVYPGPAEGLKQHAADFVPGKTLPPNFRLLLDPDYQFTNEYGLRWSAPNETAYPSTFVLDKNGKIRFAKISQSHGGRATSKEILQALSAF